MRAWLVSVVLFAAVGCGSNPAPPKVDAAAEAEDERLIKEAGERERKVKKSQSKHEKDAD